MLESRKAIYAALAGSVAVSITKLAAAAFTGSSAMLSEGLHSIVDAGNEMLLLLGKRRSSRPADDWHPFGHGQELYFWTLIVSLIIFTAGGAVSTYEGITRLLHPKQCLPEPKLPGCGPVVEGPHSIHCCVGRRCRPASPRCRLYRHLFSLRTFQNAAL
jgi:divalent metal cation (Fe/Co/Zn/Cd) transporter